MKKTHRKIAIGAIIVAVLLAVLLLFHFGAFPSLPFDISGTSTLSLSQVSLQSANPYLNGQAWLLTFSAGGLGQSYYGTITPQQVDSLTPDQTTTTKSLTINVNYNTEECQYPIAQAGSLTPIYDVNQYTYTYIPLISSCDFSTGASKSGISSSNIISVVKPSGSFTCHVVYRTGQSVLGTMGNGNVYAPYTITLNVDGQTASKTIDPLQGTTSGAIGDYAYAVWNGNLVSGVSCPASYNYQAAYVNGAWRTISAQAYNNYVNKYNTNVNLGFLGGDGDVNQWVTDVQNYAASAKQSQSFGTVSSSSSISNAVVKIPLSSPLQFPVTSLYVKATTLGIYTPVPNIQINSVTSPCFKTGATGVISAVISNTGQSAGTYTAYATCPSPFAVQQNQQGSLQPGETRTVNLPISGSATSSQTGSCTVSVETTGGTKTSGVSVCVDPQITCTVPYPQKFCGISGGSEVVQQCSQNGATSSVIQICSANQFCQLGVCVTQASGGNPGSGNPLGGIWDSITGFFSNLGDILYYIRIIVLIIAVLLSFVFTKNITQKFISKSKDKWIVYTITILVAGVTALAGYAILLTALFWIIVIGWIVVVIVLNFTGLGAWLKLLKR